MTKKSIHAVPHESGWPPRKKALNEQVSSSTHRTKPSIAPANKRFESAWQL